MGWGVGRETIDRLLQSSDLQRVPADIEIAHQLIEASRHHVSSAVSIREADPEGACQLAYDAARKACGALLQAHGLRSTSRGGHIAVREAVEAQFASLSGGAVLRGFDRLRRRRNDLEYPDTALFVGDEEVDDAVGVAEGIIDFAERLVDELPVY